MKIGIDPGNTGAIALIGANNEFIEVHDMPTMADGTNGKKQQVNAAALADIFRSIKCEYPQVIAHLEKVHAMPEQGVTGTFTFAMGFGVIQGVCAAMDIPMQLVTPQRWKKSASLIGKDKDCARTLAQQLYPAAPLARKKDIGRADAILIARFGG